MPALTPIDVIFFDTPADFRAWLEANHETAKELWVGFRKKSTGLPSMTWTESVEEALCFGWIDGIRKSLGDESYTIRFTPRKPDSIWSTVNINHVQRLIEQGRMRPAGLAAFEKRQDHRSGVYTFEKEVVELSSDLEVRFRANPAAWDYFQSQPASYRRTMIGWVTSAKREETRLSRLDALMQDSAQGRQMEQFTRYRKPNKTKP